MLILHDDAYYKSRKPQLDLGPLKNLKRFLWNPEKKSFLDRTCEAQVGLFYLMFFGVIFPLFAVKMWITLHCIYAMDQPSSFITKNVKTLIDSSNRIPLLVRTSNEGPG